MEPKPARSKLPVLLVAALVVLALVVVLLPRAPPAVAQTIREFSLTVKGAQIEVAPGTVWDAWTYNGTVPGPTLRVRVGDIVRVHLTNALDRVHSMHVHGLRYTIENDGS